MTPQLDERNRTLVLVVPGDLLSTNVNVVRDDLFRCLESDQVRNGNWSQLTIDLRGAKMVDSAGLNLIVSVLNHVKGRGARLRALVQSSNVQRTLAFTRLDRHIELAAA